MRRPDLRVLAGAALIGLAVGAAYASALRTPFVFDDRPAIVDNPTLRHLGDWQAVLFPPPSAGGVAGRPLANLSLALNYAAGGLNPWGYHVANLVLHLCAAWTLWGLLRRTRFPEGAAFAAALVWAVHPLLTEAVTETVSRTEIGVSLCCLLTLYTLARGWLRASAAFAWAAVGWKEVAVVLPPLVLLYDRTFAAGSFGAAWRARRTYYAALFASWLPLACLVWSTGQRSGTAGFGLGVGTGAYLLTQCRALALYLKLAVWPHPLVLDYGTGLTCGLAAVWPQALLIAALLLAVGVALRRRSAAGFLGAAGFLLLAPSSSLVPIVTEPIAEHRMYLPLAALVVLAVAALWRLLGARSVRLWAPLAVGFAAATAARNRDYRDERILIDQALAANPGNDRAYLNRGAAHLRAGETDAAVADFQHAIALDPSAADARFDLGTALDRNGRFAAAADAYRQALRLRPAYPAANYYLGLDLLRLDRRSEALATLREAWRQQPGSSAARRAVAQAECAVGISLAEAGDLAGALAHFEAAVRADPADPTARADLDRARMLGAR